MLPRDLHYVGHEQIVDQSHPGLLHHRIPCNHQKTLDFQFPLDSLEEQLNLPPPTGDSGNNVLSESEFVCKKFVNVQKSLIDK